ncbi:glycerophosphodiester phosphodiesterase family protein [Paraburkholderia sp. DHOC27]|uniref:glycerophosphodiester phosphodiesterase family protein n=1 Tax=Paraburkholderia sp. DHOC27 TaxID=2303330 RepID=UPI000E3D136A|nr:glycerophosphodiester phosphodiesterase family protein [Paraburkholderia sp. DHOC27]RFU43988.1 glycerophosphodiester phosphodiesterase [Paraburkholderia sp. DHOC27]
MPRSMWLACLMTLLSVWLAGCATQSVSPGAGAVTALPRIIAHRGGTGDAPENTQEAVRLALAHHADAIWLTVQLSKDGVPVLYRPADLSALTNAKGAVSTYSAAELANVNAGWTFRQRDGQGVDAYPYRRHPVGIPTLREVLRAIPVNTPVVLDMKALPAEPQTRAVAQVLTEENAWSRVMIYSTETDYQRSFAAYPQAKMFESRDATRTRLMRVLLGGGCVDPPPGNALAAFEFHRDVTVTEQFTLGEGRSEVHATPWTPASVACFRKNPGVYLVAIAVNNTADYRAAACLGMDAVLADSPATMVPVRAALSLPLQCKAER